MAVLLVYPAIDRMDLRERVGLNVQRLRQNAGLSQEECAHRAKVHQTYLSGVERGVRNPTVMVLAKIARRWAWRPMSCSEHQPRLGENKCRACRLMPCNPRDGFEAAR